MGRTLLISLALVSIAARAQSNPFTEARVPYPGKSGAVTAWQYQITNTGTVPIVAFQVNIACPPPASGAGQTSYEYREDAAFAYSHDSPILPNTTRAFLFPAAVSVCPGGVTAVIFADGKGTGDSDAIAFLYDRRKGLLLALKDARRKIDRVASGEFDPKLMADHLDVDAHALCNRKTTNGAACSGIMFGYGAVEGSLRGQYDLKVPSDNTPQHQPMIEDLMKSTGMSRQRAHATVIGKKLDEWIAALSGNLEPR